MKKLVLFLAVAFSVSLFSCGGNDKKAEADSAVVEEAAVVEEVVVPDSCCNDSACVDSCAAAEAECTPEA